MIKTGISPSDKAPVSSSNTSVRVISDIHLLLKIPMNGRYFTIGGEKRQAR
jgi:hypothetical protein